MSPRPAAATTTELSGLRSRRLFAEARRWIPGGVNSPVRAWGRLGGEPPLIERGEGPCLIDEDGRHYIDYVLSWGPLLHGHAHPKVLAAVSEAAQRGLSFGAPTRHETALAKVLTEALPGCEQVRMVNSGTEATMSALRLARAATGRDLIIKCEGCYHGHADHLLVAAGSGAATFGHPDSAGVPAAFAEKTLVVPYNNTAAMEAVLKAHRHQVAAIIIEPVAGNMGFVQPVDGYLRALRRLATSHGALLIFDEVMTGFRTAWGGYQARCRVRPDLTCLGKVIGGGMPAAAYGGKRAIMRLLAPEGPCYQAGTLSGNPVAVAAGLATLRLAAAKDFYQKQELRLSRLVQGLEARARQHGVPFQAGVCGTMWGFFFAPRTVTNFAEAAAAHLERWTAFIRVMYARGIYLAPSPFEAAFWSSVHRSSHVKATLAAADEAFAAAAAV
ncbi:MAG: glutamate-1-semialdehyde-2,1-aminomutase [Planctomycetota bacterium]|nr:MAG: glutamate-1-semialdehyde-2,1-aminomutase [Planctomycetota bacterium]